MNTTDDQRIKLHVSRQFMVVRELEELCYQTEYVRSVETCQYFFRNEFYLRKKKLVFFVFTIQSHWVGCTTVEVQNKNNEPL